MINRVGWLVGVALFLVALAPRLWPPQPFITWDELNWTYRSLKFLAALRAGDPAGTYLTGHPGVVTTWAGAAGIALALPLGSSRPVGEGPGVRADLGWVAGLPAFNEEDAGLVRQLAPWLPPARVPIAVLTAGLVVGAWAAWRRLTGGPVALLAALLLAFDPFYLAHSRVLHLDATLAGLMFVATLAQAVYLAGRGGAGWLLASGALAGLAVLEKSPAVFMIPFAALAICAWAIGRFGLTRRAVLRMASTALAWGLAAGVVYFVTWPALWADPAGVLTEVWLRANRSAGEPREAVFFLDQVVRDPGAAFYLVVSAFRLTPLTSLGLVAAAGYGLVRIVRRQPATRTTVPYPWKGEGEAGLWPWMVLAYAVLFWLFMSSGAKKFDRYILPAQPALDTLAALGLAWIAEQVAGYRLQVGNWKLEVGGWKLERRPISNLQSPASNLQLATYLVLFGVVQAVLVLPYQPYSLSYYNPLLGGGSRAVQTLPVGWGEGLDLAADYLDQKPGADRLRVATASLPIFAPLFQGQTVGLRDKDLRSADYVLVYVDDAQIGEPKAITRFYGAREPEHVVRLHGIDYAWIYRNEK
jgi:4-amino-4-deoxy-L-arabinose transferase-like glycosyltransferase